MHVQDEMADFIGGVISKSANPMADGIEPEAARQKKPRKRRTPKTTADLALQAMATQLGRNRALSVGEVSTDSNF